MLLRPDVPGGAPSGLGHPETSVPVLRLIPARRHRPNQGTIQFIIQTGIFLRIKKIIRIIKII